MTEAGAPARPGFGRRLLRHRAAVVGLAFVALLVVVAVIGPWISPADPAKQNLRMALQGPSWSHWLGTDQVGRDVLSRLIAGTRLTVMAMGIALAVALAIGVPAGMTAGYRGGWWERAVTWFNSIFFAIPAILVVFGIVSISGVSLIKAMLGLGFVFSTRYIALGTAMVKAQRHQEYVESAEVLGLRSWRILVRHISPNVLRPLVVQTSILLGAVVLVEAELSFLGLAAPAGEPSWGRMLRDSQTFFSRQIFLPVPPGLAITLLVVALNLAGDGLADAVSPNVAEGALARRRARRLAAATVTAVAEPAPVDVRSDPVDAAPVDAVLRVEGLQVSFPGRDGAMVPVVDGVSLHVAAGETLGLAGESGCGKSMTVAAIAGLIPHPGRLTAGAVHVDGREISSLGDKQLEAVRGREIAMIFQDPMAALDPSMTIGRQLAEPLRHHLGLGRRAAAERAAELLALVGVDRPRSRLGDYPHQFSGGMAQRVVIARALTASPKVLLADEPTTALDVTVQGQVLDLLADLQQQFGMSIVFVTHDLGVVADLCDRVAVMYAGQIVETAPVDTLFAAPEHPYTRALLESMPTNAVPGERLATIDGRVPPPWEWPSGCRFASRCSYATVECDRPVTLTGSSHPGASQMSAVHAVRCVHPVRSLAAAGPEART